MDHNPGLETPPQEYGVVVIALQLCKVVFGLDYQGLATEGLLLSRYCPRLLEYSSLMLTTHSHCLLIII